MAVMEIASRIIDKERESYDWVSMFPGLGLLNMNQITSFFRLLDKICIQSLGRGEGLSVINLRLKIFINLGKTLKYFSMAQCLN